MNQVSQPGVKISELARKLNLTNYTDGIDLSKIEVAVADINRPALQLQGFYDYFDPHRIQLVGKVEQAYLEQKTEEERIASYARLFEKDGIPAVIFCRGYKPGPIMMKMAKEHNIPLLGTERGTSDFMAELIYTLSMDLAPYTTIHGVLVDVYGEGLLITGESGIGKSEAALELIRRGHRLVSDDVVEIRNNNNRLYGRAPSVTKYLIELRGIGVIDVKSLYGVECVKEQQRIDLVIKLEDWTKDAEYDRLGMVDEYMDILGEKVTCHSLPIRPGRNLAVICETAAVNHRQKKMGYNAAEELYRRVQENMAKRD